MKYLLYHWRLHWSKLKTSHKCILHSVRWIRKSHMILWYGCACHPCCRCLHPSYNNGTLSMLSVRSTPAHTLHTNSRLPSNTAIILWALDDYYYAHCRKYVIRKPKTNIIMDISCYPFVTAAHRYTHIPNNSVHGIRYTLCLVFIHSFIAIPCI